MGAFLLHNAQSRVAPEKNTPKFLFVLIIFRSLLIGGNGMNNLTVKQDMFAYYMAEGFSQRRAYQKAYPKSLEWKEATTDNNAYKLLKLEYIKQAVGKYVEDKKVRELGNIQERTVILDEDVYEVVLATMTGYEDIKSFVQESTIKNLPVNFNNMEEWLKRNRRKNISNSVRYEVLSEANFKCEACGDNPKVNDECVLHVDHIVPHSKGGIDNMTNYQCLCARCNISKGNRYAIDNRK